MRLSRLAAVLLPIVLAPRGVGRDPIRTAPPPPRAHAVDVWLGHADAVDFDYAWLAAAERQRIARLPVGPPPAARVTPITLGSGFAVVGSVAVLEGTDETLSIEGKSYGVSYDNLAAISRRFIAAFGDSYDQVAVFLGFRDRFSPFALAYEMPVKNDVSGLGLDHYDSSAHFGSPGGRLKAVLNMKQVVVYGRDPANQPQNSLYYVWAQEAAHRWLVYFKVKPPGTDMATDLLLGRQGAHWSPLVQADGSIMDGFLWRDNGDGTFTPVEAGKRYGALDQYGMGLRTAAEVPPFFVLTDVMDSSGGAIGKLGPVYRGQKYTGTRVDLTIADIVAAIGPRIPATDPSAQDLRMGVVLVLPPTLGAHEAIGESHRIDKTRARWDDFYNMAGEGRGKVCTQLLRPCRGPAFAYGDASTIERAVGPGRDGVVAPGEPFVLSVPVVNLGSETGEATVTAAPQDDHGPPLGLAPVKASAGVLGPGESGIATFEGGVALGTPCGVPLRVELSAPGRLGPSRGAAHVIVGLTAAPLDTLEGDVSGWKVDPAGTDSAVRGRWQLGTPERTSAFDFILQPAGAWSGTRAFVTGASRGNQPDDEDVDGGFTTLESPALPIAGLREPHLRYRAYFVAADFDREVLIPGVDDSVSVFASADGATWTEVDRLTGMDLAWHERVIRLSSRLDAATLAASALRFRFVAEDAGVVDNVVEAVVDDIGISGEVAACGQPPPDAAVGPAPDGGGPSETPTDGESGCACVIGSRDSHSHDAAAMIVISALLSLLSTSRSRGRTRSRTHAGHPLRHRHTHRQPRRSLDPRGGDAPRR